MVKYLFLGKMGCEGEVRKMKAACENLL